MLAGFQVKSTAGSLRLENDADIAMARVLVAMANKSQRSHGQAGEAGVAAAGSIASRR